MWELSLRVQSSFENHFRGLFPGLGGYFRVSRLRRVKILCDNFSTFYHEEIIKPHFIIFNYSTNAK